MMTSRALTSLADDRLGAWESRMCGDVGPGPTPPLADVQPKPHPLKSGRKVATQAAMIPSAGSMTDQIATSLCHSNSHS